MSDEFDFEALMAMQGVQKLGKGGRRPSPKSPPPPPKGAPAPRIVPQIVPREELVAVEAERDAAVERGDELAARVAELEGRLADALGRERTLKGTLEELTEARQADADAAREAAKQADRALTDLRRALDQATASLQSTEAARTSLADALLARGCSGNTEMIAVLNGLLLQRPREFLDSVVLADPHALAGVLTERVAFVGRGVECKADKYTVVVRVPPERCEITGGSDPKAQFHGFVQACIDKDIETITVVGGSPAYRKRLGELADAHDDAPRFNLVSGTRRREKRRADSDMRASDLVVIWGGSELDHSVSDVYRGDDAWIVRVAHRGLPSMLREVRAALRKPRR